jgi:hypothetical protein
MRTLPTKNSVTPQQRVLLDTMQRYTFCRIEHLYVVNGEPVFASATRILQDIELGDDSWRERVELHQEDLVLRSSVIKYFEHLERIGDGTVVALEVRFGLPFRLFVDRHSAEADDSATQ